MDSEKLQIGSAGLAHQFLSPSVVSILGIGLLLVYLYVTHLTSTVLNGFTYQFMNSEKLTEQTFPNLPKFQKFPACSLLLDIYRSSVVI